MSTSLLDHGFGISGYQHVHTKFPDGAIHFRVRADVFSLRCPECGSSKIKCKGQVRSRVRAVSLGSKPVWIELAVPRVLCLLCGLLCQVKIKFAFWRRSYPQVFERYALELSRRHDHTQSRMRPGI
ncbi:MAG: transposase family protein [Deltaproteobacteria bacterium]|nr:MAG: transposase family protein [Deltaproteobacteria bacterium]